MHGTFKQLIHTTSDLLSHGVWRSEYTHKQPIRSIALIIAMYHHIYPKWKKCFVYNYTDDFSQLTRKQKVNRGMQFIVITNQVIDVMKVQNGVTAWDVQINKFKDYKMQERRPNSFLIGVIECKDEWNPQHVSSACSELDNWNIDDHIHRQQLDFVALNEYGQIFTATKNGYSNLHPTRQRQQIQENDMFHISVSVNKGQAQVLFKKNNLTQNIAPLACSKKYTVFILFRYGKSTATLVSCLEHVVPINNTTLALASYNWDQEVFNDL